MRRIEITQRSNRGKIRTNKNLTDHFVEYESTIEQRLYKLLIHDPHCVDLESQPLEIPNQNPSDNPYIPDTWAQFDNGTEVIFDVKPQSFFDSFEQDLDEKNRWEVRKNAIESYCTIHNLKYMIVSDNDLNSQRLANIDSFSYFDHDFPELKAIKTSVDQVLTNKELTIIELAQQISRNLSISMDEVIPVINYLIYNDYFFLDFNSEIKSKDTFLKLKQTQNSAITPLYEFLQYKLQNRKELQNIESKNAHSTIRSDNTNTNTIELYEINALPDHQQKIISYRMKLLEIFNKKSVSYQEITDYAIQNEINVGTLYRWKNRFDRDGWVGLIPNHAKKGRKKGKDQQIEALITEVIESRYLNSKQPSISGCYEYFCKECLKQKLTPCSDETFRMRILEISDKKKVYSRRGKKIYKDQYKMLEGKPFPYGKYPLDTIEIDNTDLNVILVDRIDRKPIGKPHFTIAMDVYSRMIYGFYLSFDPSNQLSIGMTLFMGISSKDEIVKKHHTKQNWPIYGLPKSVLVDNGKDFRSLGLSSFCQLYNIEITFNPVRSPEMKSYIERLIQTIKHKSRDDLIGGVTQPIAERRKTQINPEKDAEMTIDEFEDWLIHWIVDDYHIRPHSGFTQLEGMEIPPLKRYEEGLFDLSKVVRGKPILPQSLDQLHYDVLIPESRRISRSGIRMFGLEYFHEEIGDLLSEPNALNKDFIIKYDPRDIREVYLWMESKRKFLPVPLKNVYHENLSINPSNPNDNPLSKKEFENIKKNRESTGKIPQVELAEALETRQKILEDARNKTKTAKSGRKQIEKIKNHQENATSTKIRRKTSKVQNDQENKDDSNLVEDQATDKNSDGNEKEENANDDQSDNTPFPIEINWNEKDL